MKMKSIRFPPPAADAMVRAILEGRKTVTRQVVKPQPEDVCAVLTGPLHQAMNTVGFDCGWRNGDYRTGYVNTVKKPYFPGDILYVRETWSPVFVRPKRYVYKADADAGIGESAGLPIKWRPSATMPKEAARLFLRVTDVRVERLHDM